MKKNLSGLLLILLLIIPSLAYSAASSETLKEHINKVLEVLRNPDLKGEPGRKLKREKIRSISEELFDFTELSKRSLGQNWNKLNASQQASQLLNIRHNPARILAGMFCCLWRGSVLHHFLKERSANVTRNVRILGLPR